MKLLLGFLLVVISHPSLAQYKGIEVPTLEQVNTFDFIEYYMPIYISLDKNNTIKIEINDVQFSALDTLKTEILNYHVKEGYVPNSTKFSINNIDLAKISNIIPELIIDKKIRIKDLESIKSELQRLLLNTVILSSKSESYSRIESVWTTGLIYIMNPINIDAYNSFRKQQNHERVDIESIQSTAIGEIVNRFSPKEDKKNELPPPPPPLSSSSKDQQKLEDQLFRDKYPSFYVKEFDKAYPELSITKIVIKENGKFNFDKSNDIDLKEVKKRIESLPIQRNTFIVLSYEEEAIFDDFIKLYRIVNDHVFIQRESYCQKNFYKSYVQLNEEERNVINFKIPFNWIEKMHYIK